MRVPIVFCADAGYGQYIAVALQSIIDNASSEHEYHIIILSCGIKIRDLEELAAQIAPHGNFSLRVENVAAVLTEYGDKIRKQAVMRSPAKFGRLLIPQFCAEYKTVIYADMDMIFNRDAAELAAVDLGENYIGAVKDARQALRRIHEPKMKNSMAKIGLEESDIYINSGLLLINIAAWRLHNLAEKMINFLLEGRNGHFFDQDAVNALCKGKITFLDAKWNMPYYDKNSANACIVHYVSLIKPWDNPALRNGDLWWHYARKLAAYERLLFAAMQNKTGLNIEKETVLYRLCSLPLLRIIQKPRYKKYYIFGMKRGHIAELKINDKTREKAFFLFGAKLFTRQIMP